MQKLCRNRSGIIQKPCKNHAETMQKTCRNHATLCRNHATSTEKPLQTHAETIHNPSETIQKTSRNQAETIHKSDKKHAESMQKPTRNLTNGTIVLTAQDLHSKITNLLQKRHEWQKTLEIQYKIINQGRLLWEWPPSYSTPLLKTSLLTQGSYSRLLLKAFATVLLIQYSIYDLVGVGTDINASAFTVAIPPDPDQDATSIKACGQRSDSTLPGPAGFRSY